MSTIYSAGIDNSSTLPTVVDNGTPVDAIYVNQLRDTIIVIESTLGIKPQGIYGTVRARLDALEALIAAGGGGGGGGGGTTIVFAGDLTGTPTHQVVIGLQSQPINSILPLAGQTLIFDGYQYSPSTNFLGREIITGPILSTSESTGLIVLDGKLVVNGITTSLTSDAGQGIIYYDSITNQFLVSQDGYAYIPLLGGSTGGAASGDLSGNYPDPTVVGLHTVPINPTTPVTGQALIFDGYDWTPGSNFFSQDLFTTGSITTGPDLSTSVSTGLLTLDGKFVVNSITTSLVSDSGQGIIYFDGYSNEFLVSQNGSSYVPLVGGGGGGSPTGAAGGDLGGDYPNPTVIGLQGSSVATTLPADGQLLTWVGADSKWEPKAFERQPLGFTTLFIDPSNSSGLASDSNSGSSTAHPILTTAHLNALMFFKYLTADTTITYMSDDNVGFLEFSTLNTNGHNLTFQGTPVVLHTGGTLSTVVAIDPTSNQRQVMSLSDVSDLTPYFGNLLVDTSGGNSGTSAWLVSSAGVDGYFSRPITSGDAAGSFTVGDHYQIQRGGNLNLAEQPVNIGSIGIIEFNDFNFGGFNAPLSGANNFRCSFNSAITAGGLYENSYISFGILELGIPLGEITIGSGVFVTGNANYCSALITLGGDVYVTGDALFIGNLFYTSVFMVPQVYPGGPIGQGVQVFDCTNVDGAVQIIGQLTIFNVSSPTLLWGINPDAPGITLTQGTTLVLGTVPIITGLYDYVFTNVNSSSFNTNGRAWDESTGDYTDSGGPATRATTWANFVLAITSGGFGHNVHDPATNAHMILG